MIRLSVLALVAMLAGVTLPVASQQAPDTAFTPLIRRPAFPAGRGPTLCLDEAHHNFHTLDNRFLAFGRLVQRDGYIIRSSSALLSDSTLTGCSIFVISNAQPSDVEWDRYPSPTPSAFTDAEISAMRTWIEDGGRLLLIADHMPLAGAAKKLAASFGVEFIDGFALKTFKTEAGRDSSLDVPTLFRRADGTLAPHPIVSGRDASEAIGQVRSFTGQAFRATGSSVTPVLVLPRDFVSLEPRHAWEFSPTTARRDVGGWLQGATVRMGRGRVALFGEAAMFSAQVAGPDRTPVGMNAPLAGENAQFVLNTLHWLSGLIEP